jgi:hypothetical protein
MNVRDADARDAGLSRRWKVGAARRRPCEHDLYGRDRRLVRNGR